MLRPRGNESIEKMYARHLQRIGPRARKGAEEVLYG
jgi:hypothetical protein